MAKVEAPVVEMAGISTAGELAANIKQEVVEDHTAGKAMEVTNAETAPEAHDSPMNGSKVDKSAKGTHIDHTVGKALVVKMAEAEHDLHDSFITDFVVDKSAKVANIEHTQEHERHQALNIKQEDSMGIQHERGGSPSYPGVATREMLGKVKADIDKLMLVEFPAEVQYWRLSVLLAKEEQLKKELIKARPR